ncbi:D-glycerate dehydrogenase [Amylibacter sp.]|nr:D-glycerate dehydrogenase [Amylibacter sp.]MDA9369057.1 D-glycerate dehydrogenase [bacterium]MDA7758745.1 D-glycerate dehydrogenase [Amylibacter sp.]MDA9031853.1 D-glycerate dehydrogenase [Amylibacter sp.]MDA9269385.1 D-glycerate dehydrogenase [Amylibacter sp.]|tara:strand:+ start:1744 stop:2727 length:984 start_codon:yes stop_codon:yes gene_type:complete
MPNSGFKVIVTRKLPNTVQSRLKELFDVEFSQNDIPLSRNELLEAMKRAEVLVPTLNDNIDASLLAEAGNKLKLLANYGSGVDHIDVEAAHKQGILVSNSPTISSSDTADMTIALILAVMRRFKEGSNVMESGDWQGWAPSAFLGTRVSGKTIGILGMGRIGTALAERARAFGLNVHYHNRKKVHPDTETRLNAKYFKDFHAMLPEIDILATCCPLSDETHHILDSKALSLMKPTAVVVNTARGALIEETALETALLNGRLAAAGLDVLATGKNVNKTLCELPNVMLLPHMGSATQEARHEMGETVILNIKMHQDGHRPPNMCIPKF